MDRTPFTVEMAGDVKIVVFLFAELSLEDAEELKASLSTLVNDAAKNFIIDFHQCAFMSSVALGVLVSFSSKVHSYDGRIVFCSPTKEVSAVMAITKFDKIFDIYPTREEAIASFRDTGAAGG